MRMDFICMDFIFQSEFLDHFFFLEGQHLLGSRLLMRPFIPLSTAAQGFATVAVIIRHDGRPCAPSLMLMNDC